MKQAQFPRKELLEQEKIQIEPGCLQGKIEVPLSKSLAHRALIGAALAGDVSLAVLTEDSRNLSVDISTTLHCLNQILKGDKAQQVELMCYESGSTLRFLIPLVLALGQKAVLQGAGRLVSRPLKEYSKILANQPISLIFPSQEDLFLPLVVSGQLEAGEFLVPGHVSSQYITGLMMALPLLEGDSKIILTSPLESKPYVDMTKAVMANFGVIVEDLERDGENVGEIGYKIKGKQSYQRTLPYLGEGDYSQAAFWLVAKFLGNQVEVVNLPVFSWQGDQEICEFLARLEERNRLSFDFTQEPLLLDVKDTPDIVPALALAAASTHGENRIINAHRLVYKESDRLEGTYQMLLALGVRVEKTNDSLVIFGQKNAVFSACEINGLNDHRMVMAGAIAATKAKAKITITTPKAVTKSYPNFFEDYCNLGGKIE